MLEPRPGRELCCKCSRPPDSLQKQQQIHVLMSETEGAEDQPTFLSLDDSRIVPSVPAVRVSKCLHKGGELWPKVGWDASRRNFAGDERRKRGRAAVYRAKEVDANDRVPSPRIGRVPIWVPIVSRRWEESLEGVSYYRCVERATSIAICLPPSLPVYNRRKCQIAGSSRWQHTCVILRHLWAFTSVKGPPILLLAFFRAIDNGMTPRARALRLRLLLVGAIVPTSVLMIGVSFRYEQGAMASDIPSGYRTAGPDEPCRRSRPSCPGTPRPYLSSALVVYEERHPAATSMDWER